MLEKAALLDPDSDLIATYRQTVALNKMGQQLHPAPKQFKLTGPKKKKKHHH